jgi:hypothetical protein
MIRKALLGTSLLGVGWLIAGQRQDITRYLKIKQMSTGDGHPENVPARGSLGYVQPGQSLPDGVGEFDSALRGGPLVPR